MSICDAMHAPDTALFYAELTSVRKIRIQGYVVLNPSRNALENLSPILRWRRARKKFDPCREENGDFRDPVSPSLSRIIRGFITDTCLR